MRLKDRTWLLEVALARTSMAVLMRGTLSSAEMTAARPSTSETVRKVALNIFNATVRIKQSDIERGRNQLILLFKKSHLTDCCLYDSNHHLDNTKCWNIQKTTYIQAATQDLV